MAAVNGRWRHVKGALCSDYSLPMPLVVALAVSARRGFLRIGDGAMSRRPSDYDGRGARELTNNG
jgi:hypothetical protein